jgi:hypothetical protein
MGQWSASITVKAPRAKVFDLFADRENYRKLVPVGVKLIEPGTETRQGVGAIHRLGLGPLGIREQITSLEYGRRLTYRAVSPLPVRHYIGIVTFTDVPGGTRVDYTLDVEAAVPLPGIALKTMARTMAAGLGKGAERVIRAGEKAS